MSARRLSVLLAALLGTAAPVSAATLVPWTSDNASPASTTYVPGVTFVDPVTKAPLGTTSAAPLYVTGGTGGGGGGANAATTSNASDGQATSATNQQNVVYNYLFNGSTWDRVRGTGGAMNMILTGSIPAGGNAIGSVSVSNFPASQAVTNAGVFAVQNTAATPAGTNIVGKFGIDQTTPGTTNGVAVLSSVLATGAATAANQTPPQTAGAALSGALGTRTMGSDGTNARDISTTTSGALQPPTAAAGKITKTTTAVAANTSTTIAPADAARIAIGVQCASGAVSLDETGAALTAAGVGNGTMFMPTGTGPYFTPPVATRTAITAYTATAQTCVTTSYAQ